MIAEKNFAGRQTRGARKEQEDAYAFSDIITADHKIEGLLAVVADGMGGHTSGDQASGLVLENFIDAFHLAKGTLKERFKAAALAANDAIAQELKKSPELEGMGTTLLAMGITKNGVEWISVGDSPLYLWRDKTLKRLNEDHSFRPMLHEMLESGELTKADAAKHPFRNLLRSAIIGAEIELIDQPAEPFALKAGDMIIAASDGIQTLSDDQIAAALTKSSDANASALASGVLHAVLKAGHPKQDNTTVAIIKIGPEGFAAHAQDDEPESKKDTETIIMNPMKK